MQAVPRDPLATDSAPVDIAAIIAGELTALAADAKTLSARLAPGDIVSGVVLPSNGLTDLLLIDGLRVAAELPPSLLPGETITVQVLGTKGDRIELHVVPTPPGSPPVAVRSSAPAAKSVPSPASARTVPSPTPARTVPSPTPATSVPSSTPVNLVRPAAAQAKPLTPGPTPAAPDPSASARASVAATSRTAWTPPAELKTIEARLAASRATSPPVSRPPAAIPGPGPGSATAAPGPARAAIPSAPLGPRPLIAMRPVAGASVVGAPAAQRGVATPAEFLEPATLLRALRLPVTATNMAAARMALDSPERLPNALATLERALAKSSDPRITTLSTLVSFIGKIDSRSPVLDSQIAAFVDNVVTGGEAKLVGFAREAFPDPSTGAGLDAPTATLTPERAALLRAALDGDLKTQLLALANATDAASTVGEPAALGAVLAGALTAISAVQLNAAAAVQTYPDGLAFTLPVALPDGIARAHVRIDPDASAAKRGSLDGDNFHIAFVLETRHLGTVAIELVTVGRAVTLSVKTEGRPAQRVLGGKIGDLTARLESLRYRVAKADAVVATPAAAPDPPVPTAAAPTPTDATHLVDFDA